MSFLRSKFVIVGLISFFVLLVAVGFLSVLDPFGNWTFNPPNLTLILNAIFLTGTGIVVAAISAKSYIRQGNLNILFLGTAVLLSGLASLSAGRVLTVQTANYSVTIHNIGFFVSSILQVISAALILIGTRNQVFTKRTFGIIVSYTASVFFVIALTTLTLLGLTPTFFVAGGPTLLRQAVVALTIILFTLSCLILFRSYMKSKSMTLYWYSLALGLFAIGFLSLTLQTQAGDGYTWVSKIAQYTGGFYFILAVLSSRTKESSEGLSGKWAEAFGSNPKQLTTFFSRMFNAFTYCKILTNNEGKPVDYVYLDVNDAAVTTIGLEKMEVLGKKGSEIMKIADFEDWLAIVGPVAITGESVTLDHFLKFTGKWVHVSVYSPQKGYFVSISEDITDRKKAEEATAKQAELIDLSPDAIIVRKLNGTITFWSKGAEKLYGWTKEEAVGQNINMLLKTGLPQSLESIQVSLKLEGKWSGELVHNCKDGSKLVVQSYWLAKFGSEGIIIDLLESNVDITERIQMQIKLEESAVRVEEYATQMEELANQRAAQLKDAERLSAIGATAGMVGHDIRNPLQAITGDLYLAKIDLVSIPESEEKQAIQESLVAIENNVDYIAKIVLDLQDYARPLNPKPEEADLKLIITKLFAKNNMPDNIEFSVKVENSAEKIITDPHYLTRIMFNLINNAVQAMPNGGKLTVHAFRDRKDLVITVKDTGVGIPKEIQGKMFTAMFTTKAKGQGFGLPVVKRMSEALGGTVTFESQEGKGTTFIIRFPLP